VPHHRARFTPRGRHRPGYAKIAGNFSFRAYGQTRMLVSYELRTRATDAGRAFWRYWRVASPFVGRLMRAQLAIVEREAARSITSCVV
jgi:hypothetical protein